MKEGKMIAFASVHSPNEKMSRNSERHRSKFSKTVSGAFTQRKKKLAPQKSSSYLIV